MPCKRPDGLDATLVSMQTGDRLATLERLRDRIAQEIDSCDSLHNLERLAARLTAVMSEIDELRPSEEPAAFEEIARRRAARAAAGVQPHAIDHSVSRGGGRGHG